MKIAQCCITNICILVTLIKYKITFLVFYSLSFLSFGSMHVAKLFGVIVLPMLNNYQTF